MGVSSLVIAATFLLEIVAFGLAIGAAARSESITVQQENAARDSYTCDYRSGLGTGLGIAAAILLLIGQLLVTIFTKCMCSFHLKKGIARILAAILLILSWLTFLIAELFIISGTARGTYEFRRVVTTHRNHCRIVRQVVFGTGAAFTFITLMLSEAYLFSYIRARKHAIPPPTYTAPAVHGGTTKAYA